MARSSPLWWPWVQRNLDARGWRVADLARAISAQLGDGPDESVIGRWKNKGASPTRESVLAVAAVFHRDVREALVAANLVTAQELNAEWADPASVDLTIVPDETLIDEMRARLTRRRGATTVRARKRTTNGMAHDTNRTTVVMTQASGSRHVVPATETEAAPPSSGEDEGASLDANHC